MPRVWPVPPGFVRLEGRRLLKKNFLSKVIGVIVSAALLAGTAVFPVMADTDTSGQAAQSATNVEEQDQETDSTADSEAEDPSDEEEPEIIKVYLVRKNMKVRINGKTLKKRGWFLRKSMDNGEVKTVAMVPMKSVADRLDASVRKTPEGWAMRIGKVDVFMYKGTDSYNYLTRTTDELSDAVSYGSAPVITKKGVVYIPSDVFEDLVKKGSDKKISVKLNVRKNILTFKVKQSEK